MDLERAFTFIWKDEEWLQKVAIAAVLMITIIGSIGVIGWIAEIAKRVAHDEEQPIPGWEQMGNFFKIGLKIWGVLFIWSLPVVVAIFGIAILTTSSALIDDPKPILTVLPIVSICFFIFVFLYILIINLLTPPLWVLSAEGEPFNKIINPAVNWDLFKSNSGGFLIAMLVGWLISSILSSVGVFVCLIGVFFTSVIAQMMLASLFGQATAQARSNIDATPAVPLT